MQVSIKKPALVLSLGVLISIGSLVVIAIFGPPAIPYTDPTPEQLEAYQELVHKSETLINIAFIIMVAGLFMVLFSSAVLIFRIFQAFKKRK